MKPQLRIRFLAAAAGLAVLAGSAHADINFEQDFPYQPASLAGSYLAARSADSARDLQAAATFFQAALANDPQNPILLERVLILSVANGEIEEAGRYSDRLIEIDRRNPLARVLRGVKAIKSGALAEAEAEMAETARAPLAVLTSGLLSAWTQQGAGDTDKALETIDNLEGPSWYGIFKNYHTALIADLAGQENVAENAIRDAFQTDGSALRIVEAYARILARSGDTDEAVDALAKFLQIQPGNPIIRSLYDSILAGEMPGPVVGSTVEGAAEVLYGLGAAIGTDEGTELPAAYLQLALHLTPDSHLSLMALGDVLVSADRCAEAIEVYDRMPETSMLRRNTEIQIGFCLDSLERTDEAVERLDRIIQANPSDLDAVVALGNIFRSRERFAEAADAYDRGIATVDTPTAAHWRLFYYRGVARERSKRWDEAEADFLKALELNPDQPQVLNYLGYSWVDMGRNLEEGLEMIRSAVDQRPNDGYIVDSLGWAYYRLGRYEEAVTQLERAVELKPEDPVINDHLGDSYWKVGRKLEATFQWNHARDLDPDASDVETIAKKLESGLADAGQDG